MQPPVTVLMAVHNGATFLPASMGSILGQSHSDFHFLIVDDASTDGTRELLSSVADPRVEVVSLPKNVGQTAALNLGFQHATTPWIARMDADDVSAPDRLKEQMRALQANQALDCVGTGVWEFRANPERPEAVILRPERHESIWQAELLGCGLIHGSIVVRREAVLAVGGYDETYRYASDRELFLRFLRRFKAENLQKPLLGLRRHESQDSFSIRAAEEYIHVYQKALSEGCFSPTEVAMLKRSLAYSFLFRARCLWLNRQRHAVLWDWGKALAVSASTVFRHGAGALAKGFLPESLLGDLREKRLGIRYENP